jgi:UPF0271 protein
MKTIDLNADLGEGMGTDEALLEIVSSASIACGGHAGDAETIRRLLLVCKERGIRAGAHPGYADRANFGRLRLDLPRSDLLGQIRSQMTLFMGIAQDVAASVDYFKLHGALANQTAEDAELALAIFAEVQAIAPGLAVLALDHSGQVQAAEQLGLPVILEAYADRAYSADGLLVSRDTDGAVIDDVDAVIKRCVRLAVTGEIIAIDGTILRSDARSICLHGDTAGAAELAGRVREALEAQGVQIAPVAPG